MPRATLYVIPVSRPAIAARPAGEHSKRFVPDYPGDVPPILPSEWLKPLRATAAA